MNLPLEDPHVIGRHLSTSRVVLSRRYRDLSPTGQRVSCTGIAVDVCRDGKIIDHAAYYDHAAIVRQMQPCSEGTTSSADSDWSNSQADADDEALPEAQKAAQEQIGQLYTSKAS